MQALVYYLTIPFLYLIALLPFPIMYFFSDCLYWVLMLSGYRRNVIMNNLRNSFPEKNEKEILAIFHSYSHYLCDLTLETIKKLTVSKKEITNRCQFRKTDWLDKYYEEKQSFIIMLGHYGNWEWAGPSFSQNNKAQLAVIYRPLSNVYFEKLLAKIRTSFGPRIIQVNQTLRDMIANKNTVTAFAFIADQTASPENAYWMTFLNQDTAVFTGPEKLAKKFNYPVVFVNIRRIKRGYYEVIPELLFSNPKDTAENEICEAFTKRLEQEIIKEPAIWLWSHRRWKHKR